MDQAFIGILGTCGTVLSTLSLLPQVVRTWRTRSAADFSVAWLIMALVANAVWMGYGGLINAPAVIAVNVLCFLQCGLILYVRLQNRPLALGESR